MIIILITDDSRDVIEIMKEPLHRFEWKSDAMIVRISVFLPAHSVCLEKNVKRCSIEIERAFKETQKVEIAIAAVAEILLGNEKIRGSSGGNHIICYADSIPSAI